ncbi:hypothetical protein F7725_028456, partial [Dissostichus mawsoni]
MVGPFRILKIEGKVADLATEKGKKTMRINIDHLKHYVQPQTLWAKYGPYKLYSENLLVLAPGKELEGEIVNAYLAWVGAKAGVFIVDSYLMTSLWQGTHKGSLRKLDLSKHDVAAGAVCDGAHWTLIIMYLNENRSLFLNPLRAKEEQLIRCKDLARPFKLEEQILLKTKVQYPVDLEGVASMRLKMAMALVKNSDDLSQLCRACGEHSIGPMVDQWIRS